MISFVTGNLFESKAQALVNTVNIVGVMGKGMALQFKNQFPNNTKAYLKACREKTIDIGKLLVVDDDSLFTGKKLIINFPTKRDWRKPSEYEYIEKGLINLVEIIKQYHIESIAIPPLGAGNGGLEWSSVKRLITAYLGNSPAEITIFEPNTMIQETLLRRERVNLTPARAMLLSVLIDLVRHGEFVSEFAAEKIAYFLQKFGAQNEFKLHFTENFYGPYSGKVKHVLYYLNGSYITGFSSKDSKPFEELGIMMNAEEDIISYLNRPENIKFKNIVAKTKSFLTGYYSTFALELLSTIDYIMENKKVSTVEEIGFHLSNWSERKRSLFSDIDYLSTIIHKLKSA